MNYPEPCLCGADDCRKCRPSSFPYEDDWDDEIDDAAECLVVSLKASIQSLQVAISNRDRDALFGATRRIASECEEMECVS